MILFRNSILILDYNPSTDILEVDYPDFPDYLIPEIKNSLDILFDHVRSYDVKKLLIDSSKTLTDVKDEDSRVVAMYLVNGLIKTRLQKVARVQSLVFSVENRAQENLKQIQQYVNLPFQVQNFRSKSDALTWLKT